MKHGIIIPCYNEANRLNVDAFKSFVEKRPNVHLCFVNDGSKDSTTWVIDDIVKFNPRQVHLCDLEKNAGKANAVRQGAAYLYKNTNVNTIGFLDADLSTSLEEYEELTGEIEWDPFLKAVIGSRNNQENELIKRNHIRKVFSQLIRKIVFAITRLPITDTQCGAKVFHRELASTIFDKSFTTKWLFDVEILLRLKLEMGKKKLLNALSERPLSEWIHQEGSKLGLKDSLAIPFNLFTIWVEYSLMAKFKKELRLEETHLITMAS